MFEPQALPRVIGVPPGADFPAVLATNILAHYRNRPPDELARVTVLVNTRRMQRRLVEIFRQQGPLLLPRIGLVTDFDTLLPGVELPNALSPLRRRLEMAQLVAHRISQDGYAPKSATVDLADSLAALLDEMQGENVALDAFESIETEDDSGYWLRSLQFLRLVGDYTKAIASTGVDPEAKRRIAATMLAERWARQPPKAPIIIAGSTGSRGTTALLMEAAAKLANGAVVLPGFDTDLTMPIWDDLAKSRALEDHAQFRFAAFLKSLDISASDVKIWGKAPDEARNKLISLSLRPAMVTNQWLAEGPKLEALGTATVNLTLIEADQPRDEALTIAVALKEAIHCKKSAALITPDGILGRRVASTMARWGIRPDESAGVPLSLTPPGRFLRQVATLVNEPVAPHQLIALLKHPLCQSGDDQRGPHVLHSNEFELFLRGKYIAEVSSAELDDFAKNANESRSAWCTWLSALILRLSAQPPQTLAGCLDHHFDLAENFAGKETGQLWAKADGRDVLAQVDAFRAEIDFDGTVEFADYARLFERTLMAESSRTQDGVRTDIMIWGTLEARVQGADLVILGGLNEGIWPEQPDFDPWLNRRMRRDLGLLLPERKVGLSAHDYQQAIAAKEVILSRARRNEESETVPSRWLNRLTNLLTGLEKTGGKAALQEMRDRGDRLIAMASQLDPPIAAEPAKRPAPAPPSPARPKEYSVTGVRTLVRDPYAIYASKVLKLRSISPLFSQVDARLKGIVFHGILEQLFRSGARQVTEKHIRETAQNYLEKNVPWPHIRALWLGHFAQIASWLAAQDATWRSAATTIQSEAVGRMVISGTPFVITGVADRIDRSPTGELLIFDYKTGQIPTVPQVAAFDRQLLIEALMAEEGAFADVLPQTVGKVAHIGVGRNPEIKEIELVQNENLDFRIVTISGELRQLLQKYDTEQQGYISRRIMERERFEGDYDHLARFGEWDASQPTIPQRVSK